MTEIYRCDDKDVLVAYLYGELDPAMRAEVDAHLARCEPCLREVEGLHGVRNELGAWMPPEPELGFTIVQKPGARVLRPETARWQWRVLPAWAQVAAAVLVMAAGAALANVQVRYDDGGLSVSTGWLQPAPSVMSAPAPAPAGAVEAAAWRPAFDALAADLRAEMAAATAASTTAAPERPAALPAAARGGSPDAALLRRVADLIDASEQRQRQELALRLTQLGRDLEIQRRADLVRIEQNFGQVEGRTGAEIARQRELLMNYVRRASLRIPE
ncbi:MAG: anti-sigma factor [Vicinamibacterales bacterium]